MKVEVLIGMIASGKSTYARKRADEGALVISHDDLTEMLHARYRYEPGLRELYRDMEEVLAIRALMHSKDVVIDRTHLTKESRERWIRFVRDRVNSRFPSPPSAVEIVAVVFPMESPGEHASRRFEADSRGRPFEEWLNVVVRHANQAYVEPIDDSEGFDRIVCIDATKEVSR
jgi:hypothetical protein